MPEPATPPKTVYLIDGTAYIHRAYHAIRSLSNSKGFPTNAVFGFARMLIKLMDDKHPEFAAMFFDSRGPTFRHDMYPDYKANRPPMNDDMAVQIPYIKELTAGFNIPVFELPGYEADDLIGTVAKRSAAEGFDVVMVTGDKDFMQLITGRITIWDPMKDEAINRETVFAKHGLEPPQMLDVLGLAGDASDNIPGVPGIGPKTAVTLLQTFGSMDGIYEHMDRITSKIQKEKLTAHKEQAFLSRELARINTNSPIDIDVSSFRVIGPDNAKLAKIFQKLEFRQLQKNFPVESDLSGKQYHAILDERSLSDLIDRLSKVKTVAVDTETTSVDPMTAKLVGLSFAVKPHEAFYIPCGHDYPGAPAQLDRADVLRRLKPVLENPEIHKIGRCGRSRRAGTCRTSH
ncbi:MAG: DNA polymerase I, partial [Desulfobacteraceae bacterium]|nr:DNA polymerase I [Desulfobacteraceae bacterium]